MRVVCEFCKTVYNIPESKLVRDVSQATCKVCQNKIVIKRPPEGTPADEIISAPGVDAPIPRQPMATPTRISDEDDEPTVADPVLPPPRPMAGLSGSSSTLVAPLPGEGSGLSQLPETELSNSWREAILDNRPTVAMLKKMGLPGPAEGSTASGPAITSPPIGSMPPPPAPAPFASPLPASPSSPPWVPPPVAQAAPTAEQMEPTVFSDPPAPTPKLANAPPFPNEPAPQKTAGTITNVQSNPVAPIKTSARQATPPRPFVKEGSSQLLSLATGVGGSGIVAAMVWNGSWGAGLSGWIAFGVACFIAAGGLMNSLLRGPGFLAVFGVGFLASVAAIAGMLAVFLTGGPRTRVIAESHTFLAPLAAFEVSLSKGLPVATPQPTPDADAEVGPTPAEPSSPLPSPNTSPTSSPAAAVESPAPTATP